MLKFTTDQLVAQKPTIEDFRKLPRFPVVFIVHNIRSLENVGLFFRLADAFRIEKIYLTGYTGYPRMANDSREERIILHAQKEIEKTAIKTVPFVPWEKREEVMDLVTQLKTNDYQLIGVEQTDESQDYRKIDYKFPLALVFGHERTGIDDQLLEKCDQLVQIPMLGMGNSHNVAFSAAIITGFLFVKHPLLTNPS